MNLAVSGLSSIGESASYRIREGFPKGLEVFDVVLCK